ncbi:unnamed protein product [Rotaria sordida]|uniref:G-protein coupled receptors family 1 profile domain-containing protein n=1 Tax=Rotaria sordida TaxID=392033 RepID=A0A813Z5Q1_9BILA|nr:unnamed protein product [Rotaria sordida]CAF3750473.1 unnamed protein product [Rotaria sordida]
MSDIVTNLILSTRWLNIIIGIPLFIFGIIGNILTIWIFTRPRFRHTSSVRYLIACSVANFIQLAQTLLPRILTEGFKIPLIKSNSDYCKARGYIAGVATLCSLSFPCWASFDHFISTSRNATTRKYWTSKQFVYCAIFATILFWLIVQLPIVIFTRANGESCITTNIIHTYIQSYGITPLVYSILPMTAVICFNIGIVKNLRRSRVISFTNMNTRLARQVRRMLIPQLIILVLSGIPFSIHSIYSLATISMKKSLIQNAIESVILHTVRLLFYLNYVCSFYIYYIMSSEIRRGFKNLIRPSNTVLPEGIIA